MLWSSICPRRQKESGARRANSPPGFGYPSTVWCDDGQLLHGGRVHSHWRGHASGFAPRGSLQVMNTEPCEQSCRSKTPGGPSYSSPFAPIGPSPWAPGQTCRRKHSIVAAFWILPSERRILVRRQARGQRFVGQGRNREKRRERERERERAPFGWVGGVSQVYGAVGVGVAGLEHHADPADVIRLARHKHARSKGADRVSASLRGPHLGIGHEAEALLLVRVRIGEKAVRAHAVLSRPGELDHDQRLLVEGGRDSGALLEVSMRKPAQPTRCEEFNALRIQKRKDTAGFCASPDAIDGGGGEAVNDPDAVAVEAVKLLRADLHNTKQRLRFVQTLKAPRRKVRASERAGRRTSSQRHGLSLLPPQVSCTVWQSSMISSQPAALHLLAGTLPVGNDIAGVLRRMQPRCQRYRGSLLVW